MQSSAPEKHYAKGILKKLYTNIHISYEMQMEMTENGDFLKKNKPGAKWQQVWVSLCLKIGSTDMNGDTFIYPAKALPFSFFYYCFTLTTLNFYFYSWIPELFIFYFIYP